MSTTAAVFTGFGIACGIMFWLWLVFVIAKFTASGNRVVVVVGSELQQDAGDDGHVHNEDCW